MGPTVDAQRLRDCKNQDGRKVCLQADILKFLCAVCTDKPVEQLDGTGPDHRDLALRLRPLEFPRCPGNGTHFPRRSGQISTGHMRSKWRIGQRCVELNSKAGTSTSGLHAAALTQGDSTRSDSAAMIIDSMMRPMLVDSFHLRKF